MGGALILLVGVFRQNLPVILRSTPTDELTVCLKNSALWRYVRKITLSNNMRGNLLENVSAQTFAKQLLDMGADKFPVVPERQVILFPLHFCTLQSSIENLEKKVFSNIANNFRNHDWLCKRAILALSFKQ